jgi:GAF domain-containing protein
MYPQDSGTLQPQVVEEGHLRELISPGTPLACVPNRHCIALDLQVGNVVSAVLLSNDEEHSTHLIAQSAAQFGLSVFCCKTVFLDSGELLGTFDMHRCCPRTPTLIESKLIERVAQLAALAIQHHNHEQDCRSFPLSGGAQQGGTLAESPSSN